MNVKILKFTTAISIALLLSACLRVEVATPDKPININMNVKIEHEIQIKADRQVEELLKENSDLFGEVNPKWVELSRY
ncbi:YnbE family lipoprotein [Providencia rettgeri]|nr:YnbE family lipoprotein [Providencia rettgeri]MDI7242662.1 YnbE family lipoprotein [Providencia rettgeri]MDK3107732.1 YnbE family lipoprotein [Providencia rettgeri]MDL9982116.1 YnbE family lipoprotein [Providencia rettgeri]MDL9985689.1 YnbE family lipoprotein [Providencia rettgeri]MDM9284146.1 YnbE family lipoprotein [Providencia rettgeri]